MQTLKAFSFSPAGKEGTVVTGVGGESCTGKLTTRLWFLESNTRNSSLAGKVQSPEGPKTT